MGPKCEFPEQLPDMKELEEMSRRLLSGQDVGLVAQPDSKRDKEVMARVGEVVGRRAATRRRQFEKKLGKAVDDAEGKNLSTLLEYLTCAEISTDPPSGKIEVFSEEEAVGKVSNEEEEYSSESRAESDAEESGNEEKQRNYVGGNYSNSQFPGYSATSQYPDNYQSSQFPGHSTHNQYPGYTPPGPFTGYVPPSNYPGHPHVPQGQALPSHLATLAWYQQWRVDMARQRQAVQSYYFWMLSSHQH